VDANLLSPWLVGLSNEGSAAVGGLDVGKYSGAVVLQKRMDALLRSGTQLDEWLYAVLDGDLHSLIGSSVHGPEWESYGLGCALDLCSVSACGGCFVSLISS